MKENGKWGIVATVVLAGVVSLATVACSSATAAQPTAQPASPPPPPRAPTVVPPTSAPVGETTSADSGDAGKIVRVLNKDLAGSGEYGFDPGEFKFSLGETVTFEIVAETELHSFTVDGLGIDVEVDGAETPGATDTFTFTFEKAGTFPLICIYHEGNGMVGTITVQ